MVFVFRQLRIFDEGIWVGRLTVWEVDGRAAEDKSEEM